MPATGLVRRFQAMKRAKDGPVTPADILVLCHSYRVSFQAMVWRLEELKLLPAGTWERLASAGFKVQAARALLDIPPLALERRLLPLRYEVLAIQAHMMDELSEERLANLLRTDRVSARQRVHELAGTRYFDDGEVQVRQLALDLSADLGRVPSPAGQS
jgi:Zn-dependent peptidase ImmA (M78 family)